MTRGQLTLLAASVVMVGVTYLFGPLLPSEKNSKAKEAQLAVPASFDFRTYREEALKVAAEDKNPLPDFIVNHIMDSMQTVITAAYSERDRAEQLQTDSAWTQAGNSFFAVVRSGPTINKNFADLLYVNTTYCYEHALKLNPANDSVKINLGMAYMESEGSAEHVMKGVQLLKQITDKDPGNITANLFLGKYGMVSGQFDKAVIRFEKVLSVDSLNADAYLYLAEAYDRLGEKQKAIQMLEKCKSVVNDPDFSNSIDTRIERLKNS